MATSKRVAPHLPGCEARDRIAEQVSSALRLGAPHATESNVRSPTESLVELACRRRWRARARTTSQEAIVLIMLRVTVARFGRARHQVCSSSAGARRPHAWS